MSISDIPEEVTLFEQTRHELEWLKEQLVQIYEFNDFGNYIALLETVKQLQANLSESGVMDDMA